VSVIKIAFAGTRHGRPHHFAAVERALEHAVELVLMRRRSEDARAFVRGSAPSYPPSLECTDILVAHGASPVAGCLDWDFEKAARRVHASIKRYPVTLVDGKWPSAGPRRTWRMLGDFKPDVVIAMPLCAGNTKGTKRAIEFAMELGIPTLITPVSLLEPTPSPVSLSPGIQ